MSSYKILETVFNLIIKDCDLLLISWIVVNAGCFVVILMYFFEDFVPKFLHGLIRYGKTYSHKKTTSRLDWLFYVPNRYFIHFYAIGVSFCLMLLFPLVMLCSNNQSPGWLQHITSTLLTKDQEDKFACPSIALGLILLLIQVFRRLLESLFISVFSGRIHIAHYALGIVFYISTGTTIAHPYLTRLGSTDWYQSCTNIYQHLHWTQVVAVALFTWASIHQYKCHTILANLRSTTENTLSTKVYKIPHGDWFRYVSSPHYLAEILIYISFVLLQRGGSVYLWLMLLFVVQNLTLGATVTQRWYQEKFKEYPKDRTALIPFIY